MASTFDAGRSVGQKPKLEVSHTSKPEPEAETDLEVMLKPEPEPKPDCNPGHDAGIRPRRGRYAQAPPTGVATINSRFSIKTDHNQGMNFQFDAVVRDRDERRHMQGGDCECCRDVSGQVCSVQTRSSEPFFFSLGSTIMLSGPCRVYRDHHCGSHRHVKGASFPLIWSLVVARRTPTTSSSISNVSRGIVITGTGQRHRRLIGRSASLILRKLSRSTDAQPRCTRGS